MKSIRKIHSAVITLDFNDRRPTGNFLQIAKEFDGFLASVVVSATLLDSNKYYPAGDESATDVALRSP